MEKVDVVFLTKAEAEEMLQDVMDDATLELEPYNSDIESLMFQAESEENDYILDGGQVDERLAQALGVETCIHLAFDTKKGLGMYVFLDKTDDDFGFE